MKVPNFCSYGSKIFDKTSHNNTDIEFKARFDRIFWRLQQFLNTWNWEWNYKNGEKNVTL